MVKGKRMLTMVDFLGFFLVSFVCLFGGDLVFMFNS